MEILLFVSIILALYALVVARAAHKRIEKNIILSQLAESVMWNTLLETGVVSQANYDEALERFKRNVGPALTSEKKKLAQINALRGLLEDNNKKISKDIKS